METSEATREATVRAMRDRVFGRPSSDANWEFVKGFWLEPDSTKWRGHGGGPTPSTQNGH